MKTEQDPNEIRPHKAQRVDLAHLVKWIILVILILLLLAELLGGEFRSFPELSFWTWLVLLFKLLLIAIVIGLMRVQRDLKCEVTAPTGCVTPVYDSSEDRYVVVIEGTASGGAFQSYTLVLKEGATILPTPIIYPGGGASGTVVVNNGELGRIDVTLVEPGTVLNIELTVNGSSGNTKTCNSADFEIQRKTAFIDGIGEVPAQFAGTHPDDPSEIFKIVNLAALSPPGPPPNADPVEADVAIGGVVSVDGGADTYGCGRQMVSYGLQCQAVPSGSNPPQADAPAGWSDVMPALPFGDANHPRWYLTVFGMFANFVLNGDLTREWRTLPKLVSIFPWIYADRRVTVERKWNTTSLNGRYTVRLVMTDDNIIGPPAPLQTYEAATVWIDNREIECQITALAIAGGDSLGMCDVVHLSQFIVGGSKVNMEIEGTAWDPLIRGSYASTLSPNDNFGLFNVRFKKDGAVGYSDIVTGVTTSVPPDKNESFAALATQTGVLAIWDIVGALDGGPTGPADPGPKIYRGDRCAYVIKLYVRDTTHLSDTAEPHDKEFEWPFCVVNDLDEIQGLPYPVV